jgi:hypothetical protein
MKFNVGMLFTLLLLLLYFLFEPTALKIKMTKFIDIFKPSFTIWSRLRVPIRYRVVIF